MQLADDAGGYLDQLQPVHLCLSKHGAGSEGQVPFGAATFEDVRQLLEPGLASVAESAYGAAPEALGEVGAMARRGGCDVSESHTGIHLNCLTDHCVSRTFTDSGPSSCFRSSSSTSRVKSSNTTRQGR